MSDDEVRDQAAAILAERGEQHAQRLFGALLVRAALDDRQQRDWMIILSQDLKQRFGYRAMRGVWFLRDGGGDAEARHGAVPE